ncbi:protein-glutamine glutaminase family protein [Bacteriovoracaceae bacterium]|nr:protein-glutamine glutaminase family protein [Bacteriovoracaceae bacterium]
MSRFIILFLTFMLSVSFPNEIPLHQLPEWELDVIQETFKLIRDHRHLNLGNKLRAIPWLYPDNYCAFRADLAVSLIEKKKSSLDLPRKIIALSSSNIKLRALSRYAFMGKTVSWGYHVALAVKNGQQVYVLDPALNYSAPLLLDDWKNKLNYRRNLPITIINCHPYSWGLPPHSDCQNPTRKVMNPSKREIKKILRKEKRRLRWKKVFQ